MRYVYDQKELDESFAKITTDFEQLCEDLDNFEDTLENLDCYFEEQQATEFDGCLAYLKQLKEIIDDCTIRFDNFNKKYDADYEKYKDVITRLEPYKSILKEIYYGGKRK